MNPIDYYMPGDPVAGEYWSEMNYDGEGSQINPSDRSMWSSFGPVDLAPGETFTTVMAVVWARGASNLDSVRKLKEDVGALRENADLFTAPRTSAQDYEWRHEPPIARLPSFPLAASLYPNPASDTATLRVSLPQRMEVHIDVYDALGRYVREWVGAALDEGNHILTFPTADWTPGIYLVRLQLDNITETRRLVVVR